MSILEITDTQSNKKKLDDKVRKNRKELLEQKESKPAISNNHTRDTWNNTQYASSNSSYNNRIQNPNFFYFNQNS